MNNHECPHCNTTFSKLANFNRHVRFPSKNCKSSRTSSTSSSSSSTSNDRRSIRTVRPQSATKRSLPQRESDSFGQNYSEDHTNSRTSQKYRDSHRSATTTAEEIEELTADIITDLFEEGWTDQNEDGGHPLTDQVALKVLLQINAELKTHGMNSVANVRDLIINYILKSKDLKTTVAKKRRITYDKERKAHDRVVEKRTRQKIQNARNKAQNRYDWMDFYRYLKVSQTSFKNILFALDHERVVEAADRARKEATKRKTPFLIKCLKAVRENAEMIALRIVGLLDRDKAGWREHEHGWKGLCKQGNRNGDGLKYVGVEEVVENEEEEAAATTTTIDTVFNDICRVDEKNRTQMMKCALWYAKQHAQVNLTDAFFIREQPQIRRGLIAKGTHSTSTSYRDGTGAKEKLDFILHPNTPKEIAVPNIDGDIEGVFTGSREDIKPTAINGDDRPDDLCLERSIVDMAACTIRNSIRARLVDVTKTKSYWMTKSIPVIKEWLTSIGKLIWLKDELTTMNVPRDAENEEIWSIADKHDVSQLNHEELAEVAVLCCTTYTLHIWSDASDMVQSWHFFAQVCRVGFWPWQLAEGVDLEHLSRLNKPRAFSLHKLTHETTLVVQKLINMPIKQLEDFYESPSKGAISLLGEERQLTLDEIEVKKLDDQMEIEDENTPVDPIVGYLVMGGGIGDGAQQRKNAGRSSTGSFSNEGSVKNRQEGISDHAHRRVDLKRGVDVLGQGSDKEGGHYLGLAGYKVKELEIDLKRRADAGSGVPVAGLRPKKLSNMHKILKGYVIKSGFLAKNDVLNIKLCTWDLFWFGDPLHTIPGHEKHCILLALSREETSRGKEIKNDLINRGFWKAVNRNCDWHICTMVLIVEKSIDEVYLKHLFYCVEMHRFVYADVNVSTTLGHAGGLSIISYLAEESLQEVGKEKPKGSKKVLWPKSGGCSKNEWHGLYSHLMNMFPGERGQPQCGPACDRLENIFQPFHSLFSSRTNFDWDDSLRLVQNVDIANTANAVFNTVRSQNDNRTKNTCVKLYPQIDYRFEIFIDEQGNEVGELIPVPLKYITGRWIFFLLIVMPDFLNGHNTTDQKWFKYDEAIGYNDEGCRPLHFLVDRTTKVRILY